jgi:DNA-directed RNA polymerase II subunit RPB1
LNLSCTPPYNADFDGDEMNLHVPQGLEARAEAEELMLTPRMIVSPQGNAPVMKIVQDSLLGACKMTTKDVFIERDLLFYLVMWLRDWNGRIPVPAVMKPKKGKPGMYDAYWTGKQVFSMFCPKINLRKNLDKLFAYENAKEHPYVFGLTDKGYHLIEDGEIMAGRMDKTVLGSGAGAMIHVTWLELGPAAARDLIDQVQVVVNHWLIHWGFTIGVADTVADTDTLLEIDTIIQDAKKVVSGLVKKGQSGDLKRQPGFSMYESFEATVNTALNGAMQNAGQAASDSLSRHNNFKATVSSGSKGSNTNIAQILACVGQQNVEGKRIKSGFAKRTLPHFMKDDLGPEARGFVENSYLKGLSPQEFYFHAMGGREGLIDTACKTAETGYIQRRLVKSMESVMVHYDGTVRNAEGHIIQFLYGEDGMSGEYTEFQVIPILKLSDKKFDKKYKFHPDNPGMIMRGNTLVPYLEHKAREDIVNDHELITLLKEEYDELVKARMELRKVAWSRGRELSAEGKFVLPVNFNRIILRAQRNFQVDTSEPTDLHPKMVILAVKRLLSELIVVKGDDKLSSEAQKNATVLFTILTRSYLASKKILKEYRLSRLAFDYLIGEIKSRFQKAFANPGEMCGVIAAQSIGEPATQMTLNTFHFAGVSSKNVTLGVPRLKEIINVSKQLKTPGVEIHLRGDLGFEQDTAQNVIKTLEYTTLRSLTEYTEIVYDPDPKTSVIPEDRQMVIDHWDMVSTRSI